MFSYTVAASSLHDSDAVDRIIAPVAERLTALGGYRTDTPEADPDHPHVIVVATGGTEALVLDAVERRASVVPWEPTVLITHPLHNSLPASLESLARVRLNGGRGRIVQINTLGEPDRTLADLEVLHRMRQVRLGLVGAPSEWLVASIPDRQALEDRWGIKLVDVDITHTIEGQRVADPARTDSVAVKYSGVATPDSETVAASALHPALVDTIEHYDVDAVTVRCFDFLTELTTSGCIALAELNDTGIVAGCEGDVATTVSMLIARELLDSASWIGNPSEIDIDNDRILLAHCTVAPSLVDDLELHTHFESDMGIGLRGSFAPGAVTLIRLGGRGLENYWIAEAMVTTSGTSPDLCRTQVSLDVEPGRVSELVEAPLGNHLVMVRGHHRERIERWWHLAHG
ncbi:MAG: hypothetical protein CSA55_02500 [Ilumatobacter coccineus]|uniref:L-fucose isomerase C-terminal domain-containing protein n=1 Tax=Ilumatobacter coccineus TaxID=467094 RepID=A0A2G6KBE3_9ACTN|nr:MAG: hypothetical protein CSA55_02500 [Ilumatobacter coccineus]